LPPKCATKSIRESTGSRTIYAINFIIYSKNELLSRQKGKGDGLSPDTHLPIDDRLQPGRLAQSGVATLLDEEDSLCAMQRSAMLGREGRLETAAPDQSDGFLRVVMIRARNFVQKVCDVSLLCQSRL